MTIAISDREIDRYYNALIEKRASVHPDTRPLYPDKMVFVKTLRNTPGLWANFAGDPLVINAEFGGKSYQFAACHDIAGACAICNAAIIKNVNDVPSMYPEETADHFVGKNQRRLCRNCFYELYRKHYIQCDACYRLCRKSQVTLLDAKRSPYRICYSCLNRVVALKKEQRKQSEAGILQIVSTDDKPALPRKGRKSQ